MPEPGPVTAETAYHLIPRGASFSGLLAFDGDVRIDGALDGRVQARGTLRLGPAARVRADIEVDELIVEGSLEGDARARRRIQVEPGARVCGRLEAPRLAVADGCQIDGRCQTGLAASSFPPARDPDADRGATLGGGQEEPSAP
jgi:cytoskeletal protein CcmA (bactofilin family)